MVWVNFPPKNAISAGARATLGPTSLYLAGSRSCHTLAGSTTWSSAETIFGIAGIRTSPPGSLPNGCPNRLDGPRPEAVSAVVS